MTNERLRALLGGLLALSLPLADALAQDVVLEEDLDQGYADQGSVEIGGSVAGSWIDEVFSFDVGPTVGYFPVDNFEVSVLARLAHVKPSGEDGATSGTFVLEPSYHIPLDPDEVAFLFGGWGVGAGYDGETVDFELIPRLGFNVAIGRAGVLTPAVRLPIVFAPGEAAALGFAFEMGVGTVF